MTPSTFSHSQYQLTITKVIEGELPYTSSITEAGVSLNVMDNKRQVASCCRYSIQPAVVPNLSVSISVAGTHIYLTCSNKNTAYSIKYPQHAQIDSGTYSHK